MHDHHHHSHHDDFDHGADAGGGRIGHNRPKSAVQWQLAHQPHDAQPDTETPGERDLDLVEAAFVQGFDACSDPTSFLRMARIPFVGLDDAGRRLHLLRVETEHVADIGSVSPLIGGGAVRYDPLPARLVSLRRKLAFVFHDGAQIERLDLAATRALRDESASSRLPLVSNT